MLHDYRQSMRKMDAEDPMHPPEVVRAPALEGDPAIPTLTMRRMTEGAQRQGLKDGLARCSIMELCPMS